MTKVVSLNAWKGKLQDSPRGGHKRNMFNLMLYLQNLPGLGEAIKYNEMSEAIEWKGQPFSEHQVVDIRLILEAAGCDYAVNDVWPAIQRHADDNKFNPIRDYLDDLTWDGHARLDTWLQTHMGCENKPTLMVFGAKFLIGAVARCYEPGCQMDTALVLEGSQGTGKTTAVSALFGLQYMNSSISDFKSKEAAIGLQSAWCVEIAELAAMKKSDVNDVKKFITERVDRYRPPFGRLMVNRPRRCVFIGTTNERQYLQDQTGNRRFWPVPCGDVNLETLRAERDQIWAEAVSRYNANEAWWIEDAETLKEVELAQADRAMQDPWGEVVDAWLDANLILNFVTSSQILTEALKMPIDRQGRVEQMRVSDLLSKRGWGHERRTPGKGQKRTWGFVRP